MSLLALLPLLAPGADAAIISRGNIRSGSGGSFVTNFDVEPEGDEDITITVTLSSDAGTETLTSDEGTDHVSGTATLDALPEREAALALTVYDADGGRPPHGLRRAER
jgi:hypothetical protein